MIQKTELLTIEERFQVEQLGLILHRDFSVPEGGWIPSTEPVTISRPDGSSLEAEAQFNISHFNISDPEVPVNHRWRVTVTVLGKVKEDVPIGSKLLVDEELAARLLNGGG